MFELRRVGDAPKRHPFAPLMEWVFNIFDKENIRSKKKDKENMEYVSNISVYFTEFAGVCFFYLYFLGKNCHLLQF